MSQPQSSARLPFLMMLFVFLAGAGLAAGVLLGASKLWSKAAAKGVTTGDDPIVQSGSLKPEGDASGVVYYATPYTSPPQLILSPRSRYVIAKQDELGFKWVDRAKLRKSTNLWAEIPELVQFIPDQTAEAKFDPQQPDLTWEAKGIRASTDAQPLILFEQNGNFVSDFGQEGQVNFPIPYASPPNVELSGKQSKTVISECTTTGFKWKNAGNAKDDWAFGSGTVSWKAKGIRASQLPAK